MANLPVDFKDAIPAAAMAGKRRVRLTELGNGVYAVEDATEYAQQGSEYGALQVNELNRTVNGKMDSGMIVDNLPDALAVTENNVPVGCKAVSELCGKLGGCWISFTDADGNPTDIPYIHWYADDETEVTG